MWEDVTHRIVEFVQQNDNPLGLVILGASAFLEYVFPPFPGDTITLFGAFLVVKYSWSLVYVFSVLMIGSLFGSAIDYAIGLWLAKRYNGPRLAEHEKFWQRIDPIMRLFQRYGIWFVAANRFLPVARALVFVAAGMSGLKFRWVLVYGLVGAAAWNAVVLGAGFLVGANWERLQSLFNHYAYGCLAAILLFALVYWIKRRRQVVR